MHRRLRPCVHGVHVSGGRLQSCTYVGAPPERSSSSAAVECAQAAKRVTLARWFDLDDICAKVGKQCPAEITSNNLTQIKHLEMAVVNHMPVARKHNSINTAMHTLIPTNGPDG